MKSVVRGMVQGAHCEGRRRGRRGANGRCCVQGSGKVQREGGATEIRISN